MSPGRLRVEFVALRRAQPPRPWFGADAPPLWRYTARVLRRGRIWRAWPPRQLIMSAEDVGQVVARVLVELQELLPSVAVQVHIVRQVGGGKVRW